jgi:hypothetical protein
MKNYKFFHKLFKKYLNYNYDKQNENTKTFIEHIKF